ncbi:hypothetical protein Solca_2684 [Solitalea canadensis DSM 3403]|uniref:Uncharacterized protein n=2 Tax=Solitalea canadensis TaxID=995 RepID=H8KRT0_SOLCM|nr:hypothetical protein Solca_2684 [Solitalea canadensis DSM 3403]
MISIAWLSISSCEKKDPVIDQIDMSAALMNKKWVLITQTREPAVDLDADGTPDQDVYAHRADCMKDDFIVFKEQEVFEGNAGVIKCYEEPQTTMATWVLDAKNAKVSVTDAAKNVKTWEILELSNTLLKVKYVWATGYNQNITLTDVLTFEAR